MQFTRRHRENILQLNNGHNLKRVDGRDHFPYFPAPLENGISGSYRLKI